MYKRQKKLFREELQSNVPPEIEELMKRTLPQEKLEKQEQGIRLRQPETLTGREKELQQVNRHMEGFLQGSGSQTLLIRGEAGSGKTILKDALVEELPPEVAVIQTNCFKPEQNILLRPWTGIVEGLRNLIRREKISVPNMDPGRLFELFPQMDMSGDREAGLAEIKDLLKFDAIFHTLYTAMETVSEKRKLLFIFEDIQWMDPLSLSLLSSLILHQKSSRFLFLLTAQPFQEKNYQKFETSLAMYHKLRLLDLAPLDRETIRLFAQDLDLPVTVDEHLVDRLLKESEGNLFLLRECLKALQTTGSLDNLTENMRNIFKSNCFALTDDQQKILDFISLFYDGAPLAMISEYMHMNSLQALENLEVLRKNNFCLLYTSDAADD